MAMHLTKDDNEVAVAVEDEMVELEGSLLEMLAKSTTSTSATQSTSASSSPSLPPSTPPLNDGRFIFECLNNNVDDDLNDNGPAATTTTATAITLSPSHTSTTTNAMAAPSTTIFNNINDESTTNSLWEVPASKKSLRTRNPIRAIVDPIMAAAASSSASATKEELSSSADTCKDDVKEQISLAVSL